MMKKLTGILLILLTLISINSYSGPRNVLLEYCTGTWTGWGPCGDQQIPIIKASFPGTIFISYHGAGNDPWQVFPGSEVRTLLGFTGYPTAVIDRGNTPSNPYITYDLWYGMSQNRYANSSNSKVDIVITNKNFNPPTRELSLTINCTPLENLNGQYRISVVIIEDSLVYQQNHYSQCGIPGYDPDYIHFNVARAMVNGATGENLNSNSIWSSNDTIPKIIYTVLNPAWVASNCKIIVFVYKEEAELALSNVEQVIQEYIITPPSAPVDVQFLLEAKVFNYTLHQQFLLQV